jgi:porin
MRDQPARFRPSLLPLSGLPLLLAPVLAQDHPVVDLGVESSVDAAAALAGERDQDASLHGIALLTATYEATAWSAYASVLGVGGRGPTERITGDFLAASNTEAHQGVRLFEWWAETTLDRWSLRAGALLADAEFAGTGPGANLINSGFGWPAFISANTLNTGPAYYAAALGVRLAHAGETTTWRLGVYDGDSFDSATGDDHPNRHGLHYQLDSDQGAFVITEVAFAPADSAWRGTLGAWAHTADFTDLGDGSAHAGNHGAYAGVEHDLAGTPGEPGHLCAHLRAGLAPEDRNTVAWAADAALALLGPLPGRPADTVALGLVHAELSSRLPGQDHEQVLELSYTAELRPGLSLQPDLQYIRHPGADPSRDDAVLFILRLNAAY